MSANSSKSDLSNKPKVTKHRDIVSIRCRIGIGIEKGENNTGRSEGVKREKRPSTDNNINTSSIHPIPNLLYPAPISFPLGR